MNKSVNAGVFLLNNLSSSTFKWLSRVLQSLTLKLMQISPFPDYICSHLLVRDAVSVQEVVWQMCTIQIQDLFFFDSLFLKFKYIHHSTMVKHVQNVDTLERPGKRARIQSISRGVLSAKETLQKSKAKQPKPQARLAETSPQRTASSIKGKEKAIDQPLALLKRQKRSTDNISLPTSFKVVAGSYEKLLYGLNGTITVDDHSNLQFHLKPIFIFPAHVSCIKTVAASPQGGKWLATGSADEIVKVWDLRRRKEIGGLMHHEG